ncbi:hypothetical protein CPter291_1612 [Collimonas pratensis]|uniref:Uncharacterized protein n=1 Tax=Collimonas pratensis TaxID=279113 RepID=A0ABN4M9L3_9BURK|nr:hypothetical protein CPter291_1612 [Collimonas pratensis]
MPFLGTKHAALRQAFFACAIAEKVLFSILNRKDTTSPLLKKLPPHFS